MRLLLVGANGQLGWEIQRQSKLEGISVVEKDLPEFDMTDHSEVDNVVETNDVDIVINAAAYTAVDNAEKEPDIAYAVNREAPGYLAEACSTKRIPLIHISTDYVFDGKSSVAKEGYKESDTVSPIGIYGKSKVEGECRVREVLTSHIIIRTAWLYGVHGQNFVKTMLRLGKERERLRVVADQYGCPTYAADLASALLIICRKIQDGNPISWGTFHYCGKGETSWHGLAEEIFSVAAKYDAFKVQDIQPITTTDYPTPAKRPPRSALNCTKIKECFDIEILPWRERLNQMISSLYKSKC